MAGVQQILFLVALVAGGGYLGYWLRRFEMSGFELWFPMGLLISYAYSPLIGFVIAFSILVFTWALFPYGLHHAAITAASFGIIFFAGTHYFPVAEANFFQTAMMLAVFFNIFSNVFYFLTGYQWIRILKFIIINLFFCWIIFSRVGWQLIQWLQ